MNISSTEKYFLFVLLLIVLIITFLIFAPFVTVLILAAAFSVVLHPVYRWIKRHITRNISWLASLLTVIIFLVGLCIPLFFIGKEVFYQTQNLYQNVVSNNSPSHFIESIDSYINKLLPSGFAFDTHTKIAELVSSFTNSVTKIFSSTLNSVLMFILMVFSLFYLLKDGDKWKSEFINIFPLKNEDTSEILLNLKRSINRIFKGSFIISITQGLLAWAGFTIFGVPNAILWAVFIIVASFVPTVGTALITVPIILFLFFTGMHIQALGLLIWSVVAVGTIDNILSPYIISRNTEIPSMFILFSILGAITMMGPLGILIGPLVLSLLYSLISIYKKEIKN